MSAHPFDIFVGNQIRLARLENRMSQTELARHLDITFQQVQKYEKGTNRTSCSRLYEISESLEKPLSFFLEGFSDKPYDWEEEDSPESVSSVVDSSDALKLLVAFKKIDSKDTKKSLVAIAGAIASQENGMKLSA